MWWTKSRSNKNVVRLLRQVSQSEFEEQCYPVKRLRKGSYEEQTYDIRWYDLPDKSSVQRSWKKHRNSQYKV